MLLCFAFCGCSNHGSDSVEVITASFKCDFSVDGSDLGGEMSVNGEGDITFLFSSPDNINGTSIRVKEESVILEVHGISERYPRSQVPSGSPTLYIYDVLTAASALTPTPDDTSFRLDGQCLSGGFSAKIGGTGFIESLTLKSSGSVFCFSNHAITEN